MNGKHGGGRHRDRLETEFDAAFTIEGAMVEARLDPVLIGLANDLFKTGHPMAGFAISALVLDRCRRTLTERFEQEQFDTAAAAVLAETFERVGRDVVVHTAKQLAAGENFGDENVFSRLIGDAARNAFRRGKWWGFRLGVLAGIPLTIAGLLIVQMLLR